MADDAPIPLTLIEKSASHRTIHSNFYRYRIGMGDFSILFGTIKDGPSGAPTTVVEEEVTVAMSWQQTKLLSKTLAAALSIIEQEIGEIIVPLGSPTDVEAQHTQTVNIVRSMFETAIPKRGPKAK